LDTTDYWQGLFLIVLIGASAFFSASETALLSLSKIRLKHMVKENVKNAKRVEKLLEEPNKLIGTILIGNNVVNIGASSLATALAIKLYPNGGVGISTAIMTILVLIFGEVTPKNLAIQHSEKFSLRITPIIDFLVKLFSPLVFFLTKITNLIVHMLGGKPDDKKPFITEEELKTLVDVSSKEGVLEHEEKEMIYNIFEFGDLRVADVMIQRMDIKAISVEDTYDEIIEMFKNEKFSRLPVYEDTIDNIIGVLYAKDLFFLDREADRLNFDVRDYMRAPFNTFEFIMISDFFKQMQGNKIHMATVLDEYGGVAGIITMEDIVESIFGEIDDEYDDTEEEIEVIKEDEYVVNGAARLSDLNDMLGINLESEDFESVGGFIIGEIGRLPKTGEVIQHKNIKFIIENVDKNRIKKVRIFT